MTLAKPRDATTQNPATHDATTLMDQMYRYQRHIYDITRKFYLLGRDELIEGLAPPPGASVAEIGCGTGRNLIAIARAYPSAICYGLDISEEMLTTARANVLRAGLQDRITLRQADATTFDPAALFGRAAFDRIVISYALSMIPPWKSVLHHGASLLAPGGSLHTADFGDQARLPAWFKTLLVNWLAAFHVTPRVELPAAIESVGRELGLKGSSHALYRGYAILGSLTRISN